MLVDHNEFQQSISDISEVNILAVVDHHRIANFETANPLYYRAEPVGCTSTIILKLYKENQVTIPKEIAGIMLSAIISDTLLFKSPTCTPEDEAAAKELAAIAQVNTVDLNEVMDRQAELEAAMEDEMKANGYDLFVLVVTNILDSDSELLVAGKGKEKVEEAFQTTLTNNRALLKGVVSRKKQVVPQLTAVFS